MKLINALLALAMSTSAAAMPDHIRGDWVIDAEATREAVRNAPEYDDEIEKYLPWMIKRVAGWKLSLTEEQFVIDDNGKSTVFEISETSHEEGVHVLHSDEPQEGLKLTLRELDGEHINVASSDTDDLDYYVWQRAAAQ